MLLQFFNNEVPHKVCVKLLVAPPLVVVAEKGHEFGKYELILPAVQSVHVLLIPIVVVKLYYYLHLAVREGIEPSYYLLLFMVRPYAP